MFLLFPDGGAGFCLPWKAVSILSTHLHNIVHHPVEEGAGQPKSCSMSPGHLDDIAVGHCLQLLNIVPHHALVSPAGHSLFHTHMLPAHQPVPNSSTSLVLNIPSVWMHSDRLQDYFLCAKYGCADVPPQHWVDAERAISFHNYKNFSLLPEAYHNS